MTTEIVKTGAPLASVELESAGVFKADHDHEGDSLDCGSSSSARRRRQKDQISKVNKANQAEEVSAFGHAVDKARGKVPKANQAEEVPAGGHVVGKDQDTVLALTGQDSAGCRVWDLS